MGRDAHRLIAFDQSLFHITSVFQEVYGFYALSKTSDSLPDIVGLGDRLGTHARCLSVAQARRLIRTAIGPRNMACQTTRFTMYCRQAMVIYGWPLGAVWHAVMARSSPCLIRKTPPRWPTHSVCVWRKISSTGCGLEPPMACPARPAMFSPG